MLNSKTKIPQQEIKITFKKLQIPGEAKLDSGLKLLIHNKIKMKMALRKDRKDSTIFWKKMLLSICIIILKESSLSQSKFKKRKKIN
jgi:hypothetical protein